MEIKFGIENHNVKALYKQVDKRVKEILDDYFKVNLTLENIKEFVTEKRKEGYEIVIDDGFNFFGSVDVYLEIRKHGSLLKRDYLYTKKITLQE
jgi:hypothetical protein